MNKKRVDQLCYEFDKHLHHVGLLPARLEFAKRLAELEGENERLKEEKGIAMSLVHHIRGLPTTELDGKAYEKAHEILKMRDNE